MDEKQAFEAAMAKYPLARKTPVDNVASWGHDKFANRINLDQDTRAYGWKGDTLKAIKYVLKLQNKI